MAANKRTSSQRDRPPTTIPRTDNHGGCERKDILMKFKHELESLYYHSGSITNSKMTTITSIALEDILQYKYIVYSVERFAAKCHPMTKLIALYIINSIVRSSKKTYGANDLFEGRFATNLATTVTTAYRQATTIDKPKILDLVHIWRRLAVFKDDLLVAILETITTESKVPMSVKFNSPEPDVELVAARVVVEPKVKLEQAEIVDEDEVKVEVNVEDLADLMIPISSSAFTEKLSQFDQEVDISEASVINPDTCSFLPVASRTTTTTATRERSQSPSPPPVRRHPAARQGKVTLSSSTLWVGQLPKHDQDTLKTLLNDLFGRYGPISTLQIIPTRGCAYIRFDQRSDAVEAMTSLRRNHLPKTNRPLKIAWAAPTRGVSNPGDYVQYFDAEVGSLYIPNELLLEKIEILDQLATDGALDHESMSECIKELYNAHRAKVESKVAFDELEIVAAKKARSVTPQVSPQIMPTVIATNRPHIVGSVTSGPVLVAPMYPYPNMVQPTMLVEHQDVDFRFLPPPVYPPLPDPASHQGYFRDPYEFQPHPPPSSHLRPRPPMTPTPPPFYHSPLPTYPPPPPHHHAYAPRQPMVHYTGPPPPHHHPPRGYPPPHSFQPHFRSHYY